MREIWIFGYGSLIWRPDMAYRRSAKVRVHGWSRRFWQGSHDHRGVPEAPGRVVTLVPDATAHCDGVAYLIDGAGAQAIFAKLDYREKNGYEQHWVDLVFDEGHTEKGLVYIATEDNIAFLGPASVASIARQIHRSTGPSGTNVEYLLELAQALRALAIVDPHVFELEYAVREMVSKQES